MNGRGPVILVGLCVVAAAVVSGWPGLDNGFLNFDDPDVIESNERLDSPTIVDAVDVFGEVRDHAYLPLYYLFLMPDAYDGKDPRNFHIGSLIWHALAGVLILALMWRLTARLLPAAAGKCCKAEYPRVPGNRDHGLDPAHSPWARGTTVPAPSLGG